MEFDLVDSWFDFSIRQEIHGDLDIEVRNANALGESFFHKCFHLGPCFVQWNISIALLLVIIGNARCVEHVAIHVFKFQFFQSYFQSCFGIFAISAP